MCVPLRSGLMNSQRVKPGQAILIIAAAIAVIAAAILFVSQPWNSARTAQCDELFDQHVQTRTEYLSLPNEEDKAAFYPEQSATFEELGNTCGWEQAQAADMQARVSLTP